jgi:PTS system nitrogen regulatory IIA component
MSIQHCFDQGTVITDLQSADKFGALQELIRRAPVFGEIPDLPAFEQAVLARERLQSTGLGHSVAVAHGRIAGLERVLVALGISAKGIPYDSPDGAPVRLLFVIASPQHVSLDYLQLLSTLVRCLRNQPLRESLLSTLDENEVQSLIRRAFTAGSDRSAGPLAGCEACKTTG